MTILVNIPTEQVYYDFEDAATYGPDYDKTEYDNILICGNDSFRCFGNPDLLAVVKNDYYDDESGYDYNTLDELEKLTGKTWQQTVFRGYVQGDWQTAYYTDSVSASRLAELEAYYMGKVDGFAVIEEASDELVAKLKQDNLEHEDLAELKDSDYVVFVPHDIVWDGSAAICEYLGISPESTVILDSIPVTTYTYKKKV